MTDGRPPSVSPIVGRVLAVSAALMFVFSILCFNDLQPMAMSAGARQITAKALFFAGMLDMGLAGWLSRRAR
jgi:branched-subunit amino acid transport protein AzlD